MSQPNIFNIVAEFNLNKKPDWLDGFRKKYDKPYRYHITLKTCTFFDNNKFENLKNDLESITKKYNSIQIIFNELFMGHTSTGECIMIKADKNKKLFKLQKEIANKFSNYGEHVSEEYKKFESNFEPHITIARHLTCEQYERAKNELIKDLYCKALIKEIVLTVARENTFEEWSKPENKLSYFLNEE